MKTILQLVEHKKEELQNNVFCEWMTTLQKNEDPFSFVPAMAFFVLSFRDILNLAKRPGSTDKWDIAINHHCEEDKNHWLWYVHDLEKLGFAFETWGPRSGDILRAMWSDSNRPVRDMVYLVTHLVQNHRNPFITLAVIESLEAAFGVFIEVLRPQVKKHELYEQLKYFGKEHDEGEQSHALGNWVDGVNVNQELETIVLTPEEISLASECVNKIFKQFDVLFLNWFETRGRYKREKNSLATTSAQSLPI